MRVFLLFSLYYLLRSFVLTGGGWSRLYSFALLVVGLAGAVALRGQPLLAAYWFYCGVESAYLSLTGRSPITELTSSSFVIGREGGVVFRACILRPLVAAAVLPFLTLLAVRKRFWVNPLSLFGSEFAVKSGDFFFRLKI